MRIGIDARMYGHTQTGIGNYTKFLIKNLEHISGTKFPNVKFFVFLRKNGFKEFTEPNDNFVKVIADYKWYSFEEQIKFPVLLYKYKLDVLHDLKSLSHNIFLFILLKNNKSFII